MIKRMFTLSISLLIILSLAACTETENNDKDLYYMFEDAFFDEETKKGVSGCKDCEDESLACQVAKAYGKNIKFSTEETEQYKYKHQLFHNKQAVFFEQEYGIIVNNTSIAVDKPVIYLYPKTEQEVTIKLNFNNGNIKTSYPKYNDEWKIVASPNGKLTDQNGRNYDYLFYDGSLNVVPEITEGFVIKGSESIEFLEEVLSQFGLTDKEANEFIVYWAPYLEQNKYNLISFQNEWFDSKVELEITPAPDTIFRLFMIYKPLDNPIDIQEQEIISFNRAGFTVVEWGGGRIEN